MRTNELDEIADCVVSDIEEESDSESVSDDDDGPPHLACPRRKEEPDQTRLPYAPSPGMSKVKKSVQKLKPVAHRKTRSVDVEAKTTQDFYRSSFREKLFNNLMKKDEDGVSDVHDNASLVTRTSTHDLSGIIVCGASP